MYEFKKLFSYFGFKNNTAATLPEELSSEAVVIEASSDWDKIDFEAGNRWIGFECDKTEKSVKIYHMPQGNAKEEFEHSGFIPASSNLNDAVNLKPGQYFTTNTSTFDEAGHLIKTEANNFKLPASEILINGNETIASAEDNKLHFITDTEILLSNEDGELKFSHNLNLGEDTNSSAFEKTAEHNSPDAPAAATELASGDYFSTFDVEIDKSGHITKVTEKAFKLPISNVEADISDIELESAEKRLTDLEAADNAFITEEKVAELYETKEDAKATFEHIETTYETKDNAANTYLTKTESGELQNMYEAEKNAKSFADTIGKVDGEQGYSKQVAILAGEDQNTVYTLSGALVKMATTVKELENRLKILEALVAPK